MKKQHVVPRPAVGTETLESPMIAQALKKMPGRILVSRAFLARGSRQVSMRALTALARLGHIHLPLPASKLHGKVILAGVCIPGRFDALAANCVRVGRYAIHASYALCLTHDGRARVIVLARGLPGGLIAGALGAGPAVVITAACLSHTQASLPAVDAWDAHHHDAVAEVRLIADRTHGEREGVSFPALVAIDCFRIVTGLVAQSGHARDTARRITVTVGIRN